MKTTNFIATLTILLIGLVAFIYADSCFGTCCNSGEWNNYSYGNFSKRGTDGTSSDCSCLTDVAFSCNKTEPIVPAVRRSIKDHCFTACCSHPGVVGYSYGEAAVIYNQNSGSVCACGNQPYFSCKQFN